VKHTFWSADNAEIISCKDKLYELVQSIFCLTPEQFFTLYEDRSQKEFPRNEFMISIEEVRKLQQHIELDLSLPGMEGVLTQNGLYIPLSCRNAMIYVSECVMKVMQGSNYFGVARVNSVLNSSKQIIIDDSSAAFNVNGEIRADEVYPLIDAIGQENILLLRIHRDGCTFEADSRRYVPDGVVTNTIDVYNNTSEEGYLKSTSKIVFDFVNSRLED
jgi:hypothetical protein